MTRWAIIALACSILLWSGARHSPADEFYVAHWNVENLFDSDDDPDVEFDEDFTPDAPKRWTRERLEIKLENLARIIRKMHDGRGPDVLGLCEVENRKVLDMLVEKLAPLGRKYEIVHQDSPSDRGIDCALVFDAAVFTLVDAQFHHVEAERTRDIIETRLRRTGDELIVFVNHWPSRRNDEAQRVTAARVLRSRVDALLAANPGADILMIGDFNDEPGDVSLKVHLRAAPSKENLLAGDVYNSTADVHAAGKGTFVYDNQWQLIDHIVVSPGLLDDAGFRWKEGSSQPLDFPELFFQPRFPEAIARPSKSYSKNNFHKTGYSDHLAVACVLVQ